MSNESIRNLVYSVIFATLIIVSGVAILNNFDAGGGGYINNDTSVDDFNKSMNKYTQLQESISRIETNVGTNSTDSGSAVGAYGFLDKLIQTSYASMKGFFGTFSFVDDMINNLGKLFNVPSFVITLIILTITTLIAFQILSAIFQRDI